MGACRSFQAPLPCSRCIGEADDGTCAGRGLRSLLAKISPRMRTPPTAGWESGSGVYFTSLYAVGVQWAAWARISLFVAGATLPSVRWAHAAKLAAQRDGAKNALCGVPNDPFDYLLYPMYATVRLHNL
jgi:hypothetical protein